MIYSVTFTRKNCRMPQPGTFILLVSSRLGTKWLRWHVSLQLTTNIYSEVKYGFWPSLKWGHFWEQSNDSKPNLCIRLCMLYVKHPAATIWPQECKHTEINWGGPLSFHWTQWNIKIKVQPNTKEFNLNGLTRAQWRRRKK